MTASNKSARALGSLVVCVLVATAAATLPAQQARAEQPSNVLSLRSSKLSALRADNFDRAAIIDFSAREDRATPAHHHIALLADLGKKTSPQWPKTSDDGLSLRPPLADKHDNPFNQNAWFEHSAWGVASTGASLFGGALLYHGETQALQQEHDQLILRGSAQHAREVQERIDQTRRFMIALYAVSGSVITGGIILLTDDNQDLNQVRAEIVPTWSNGGPAAHLKITF